MEFSKELMGVVFLSKSILWVIEGIYCFSWVLMGRGLAIPLSAFFRYMVLSHHTLAQGVLKHGLSLARSTAERLEQVGNTKGTFSEGVLEALVFPGQLTFSLKIQKSSASVPRDVLQVACH